MSSKKFTTVEIRILKLLMNGLRDFEIALVLASNKTNVEKQLKEILNKLNARSKTEAVINAIKLGIISLS